jgi:hypothetical protein
MTGHSALRRSADPAIVATEAAGIVLSPRI